LAPAAAAAAAAANFFTKRYKGHSRCPLLLLPRLLGVGRLAAATVGLCQLIMGLWSWSFWSWSFAPAVLLTYTWPRESRDACPG